MLISLAAELFPVDIDIILEVYDGHMFFSTLTKECYYRDREYFKKRFSERSETGKLYISDFWDSLHTLDTNSLFSSDFRGYSRSVKRVYELSHHMVCYMVPAVSSFAEPDHYPERLVDGNESTYWSEGVKGAGLGQWIAFPLLVAPDEGEEGIQIGFAIVNGNRNLDCNRVASLKVQILHGCHRDILFAAAPMEEYPPYYSVDNSYSNETFRLHLKDTSDWQYISFEKLAPDYIWHNVYVPDPDFRYCPESWVAKLSIDSVYYGKDREHTCLSEIRPLFRLNDREYITFDCEGRMLIVPSEEVVVLQPERR